MQNVDRLRGHLALAQQELTNALLVLIDCREEDLPLRMQCELETALIRVREAGECVKVARAIAGP